MAGNRVEIIIESKDNSAAGFDSYDTKLKKMETDSDTLLNKIKEKFRKSGQDSGKGFGDGVDGETKRGHSRLASIFSGIGEMAGKFTMKGMGEGLKGAGEAMGSSPVFSTFAAAAAVTFVAIAAPAIAAGLAAAVGLGLGGAGIGAGVMAAMRSPGVQDAIADLKGRLSHVADAFGKPFIEPVKRALATFGEGVDRLAPSFGRIGAAVAPLIDKLAPALVQMAQNAMPGLEKAMRGLGPLFQMLADKAPEIGEALGSFFEDIADSGDGATRFFGDLIDLINFVVTSLGAMIKAGSAAYEWLGALGAKFGLVDNAAHESANANRKLAESHEGIARKAREAADAVKTLIDKMIESGLLVLSAREGERRYQEALDGVTSSLKANGRTLSDGTAKGRANASALDAIAQSTFRLVSAQKGQAGGQDRANRLLQRGADDAFNAAVKMGMTASAAADYTRKLFGIPPSRTTVITARNAAKSKAEVQDYNNALLNIPRNITTTIHVRQDGTIQGRRGGPTAFEHGGVVGSLGTAASGGLRGGRTLVGENGPEILDLAPGSRITPAAQTRDQLAADGQGGGVTIRIANLNLPGVKDGNEFVRTIQRWCRDNGPLPLKGGVRTI